MRQLTEETFESRTARMMLRIEIFFNINIDFFDAKMEIKNSSE